MIQNDIVITVYRVHTLIDIRMDIRSEEKRKECHRGRLFSITSKK